MIPKNLGNPEFWDPRILGSQRHNSDGLRHNCGIFPTPFQCERRHRRDSDTIPIHREEFFTKTTFHHLSLEKPFPSCPARFSNHLWASRDRKPTPEVRFGSIFLFGVRDLTPIFVVCLSFLGYKASKALPNHPDDIFLSRQSQAMPSFPDAGPNATIFDSRVAWIVCLYNDQVPWSFTPIPGEGGLW